jgi:pyruvate dehydrogenase E2 component (dihydrolipoamide acetyltransferase)
MKSSIRTNMAYTEIVLPNLGFGMEEGRLLNWLKKPGDTVKKGEPVAEIESDKANVELEALVDGVLDSILVAAEQVVPVGTVLGRIRSASAEPAPAAPAPSPSPARSEPAAERGLRISPVALRLAHEHGIDPAAVKSRGGDGRITREDIEALINRPSNGKVLAAPAVRKFARDHNLDLTVIRGTGKEGRIRREDVEAALKTPPQAEPAVPTAAPPLGERREITITPMRQAIAHHLSRSAQEAPHFFTTAELDFTAAIAQLPQNIGINTLILKLCIQALQALPELNATYENGHLYHYDHVHLALAVALPNGLISPVLHRAGDYSLSGLAERSRDLIQRARANKLKPDELSGGTFTLSNLGIVKQVDRFTAIINPPQVAILAVGAVKPRPAVINGGLHIRTTGHLTLSADHRIVDGMLAARFLEAFDHHLQAFQGA